MIGGKVLDLAATAMMRGSAHPLATLGLAPSDLEVLDRVTARADHLHTEQWRTLLAEHAGDVAEQVAEHVLRKLGLLK